MKAIFDKAIDLLFLLLGVETEQPSKIQNVPMTQNNFVPNGVLFKLTDGSPCIIRRTADGWDLENVLKMNVDHWPDISVKNPFEFVFVHFSDDKVTTNTSKTVVPNHSCFSLHMSDLLLGTIEDDYKRRYNK